MRPRTIKKPSAPRRKPNVSLARALLRWYDRHGRHDLPWRASRDPYGIWVSEIMLQQTQVTTVLPYYARFMQRFPDIAALARAQADEVLHLWTGLGYYARARNLHRAARILVQEHAGRFPVDVATCASLPGIGRSTAGAILAFAFNRRLPILDGNVKRVLARYHRVAGWPGHKAVERELWKLAEAHTPRTRVADYTQAIMDLGATVCRRAAQCTHCPLAAGCAAHRHGDPASYPARAARRPRPHRHIAMLLIRDARDRVLLQQRPPAGVWGGLWGFPECAVDHDVRAWCRTALGLDVRPDAPWSIRRHSFTHFDLDITPIPARVARAGARVMENARTVWYNPAEPDARGLAAPVVRLLEQLRNR